MGKVTDPMGLSKTTSEEVKQLFKKAAPATDQEKLATLKETRAALAPGSGLSLAHHRKIKRAPKPAPTPKPAPKKEVADEGGSAAAFDDLKELNTFSAQEDQAIAAQLDGEAVVSEIGKSLGKAINPEVKNGDAKWAKKQKKFMRKQLGRDE